MALQIKSGSFTLNGTTGSQTVTGVGFTPVAVIFAVQNLTTDGVDSGSGKLGFGMATSSTKRVGFAIADSCRATDNAACILLYSGGGSSLCNVDLTNFNSDGFVLNIVQTNGSQRVVCYTAIGGADVTNAEVVQFQCPASTGSYSYSSLSFKPDAIIFMTAGFTALQTSEIATGRLGIGFTSGSTNSMCMTMASENTAGSRKQLAKCIHLADVANTIKLDATLTSFDSAGFTLNFGTVETNDYIFGLCIKGGQYTVGTFTESTTNNSQAITGITFAPKGQLLMSYNAVSGTSSLSDVRNSFGSGESSTSRWCVWKGTFSPSDDCVYLDRTKTIRLMTSASSTNTNQGIADLTSEDGGGFTLSWTATDGTTREIIYLAMGDAPGAETITIDKWFQPASNIVREPYRVVAY
jgi:hypothetical protein